MTEKDLARLFDMEPSQWGLRGDPMLWRDMKRAAADTPWPENRAELEAALERLFEALTGEPLAGSAPVVVRRYADGGLSSGQVSREYWHDTLIPLLKSRYVRI